MFIAKRNCLFTDKGKLGNIVTVWMTFYVPKFPINLDINGCLKEQACWALVLLIKDKPYLMKPMNDTSSLFNIIDWIFSISFYVSIFLIWILKKK